MNSGGRRPFDRYKMATVWPFLKFGQRPNDWLLHALQHECTQTHKLPYHNIPFNSIGNHAPVYNLKLLPLSVNYNEFGIHLAMLRYYNQQYNFCVTLLVLYGSMYCNMARAEMCKLMASRISNQIDRVEQKFFALNAYKQIGQWNPKKRQSTQYSPSAK